MAKAVHVGTGMETGTDGHLAAPSDENPELRKHADKIEAEFGGLFDISARFGFYRADYANLPPGAVAPHYEADTAEGLRIQLRVALRMAAQP